jgi:hypothetical protein
LEQRLGCCIFIHVMRSFAIISIFLFAHGFLSARSIGITGADSSKNHIDTTITFKDVNYYIWKNPADRQEFYRDLQRIRTVLPYVKMARHLYADAQEEKEQDNKRQYRRFRKDMEKEMRAKFEKEVKDLYISDGKVLFKLLSRETGNSSYQIIKEVKGGFSAWTYQIVARHYTYDLKEQYDPHKDWILEMAIHSLGSEYDPK